MTTADKPQFPTTTTHAVRLCLFQPTRRPQMLRGETIVTPWGTIKLWGRLGQQHADVLEAICYEREARGDLADGRIKLLVDPAKVRRRSGQTSGERFAHVLKELEQAVIEIVQPDKLACSGHLIDHIDYAVRSDGTKITRRNPLTGAQRPMWRVELGKAFCKLLSHDIWVGYDPMPIARLRHGISQAIARHVLTQKTEPNGGWTLDGLIRTVAGEIDDVNMRHRRREARADADGLAAAGVLLEDDRVRRGQRTPDGVQQRPDGVQQRPDGVQQRPDGVQQRPDACSKGPESADT